MVEGQEAWDGCEAKLVQPVKTQDNPMDTTKQLEDLKVCSNGGKEDKGGTRIGGGNGCIVRDICGDGRVTVRRREGCP